MLAVLLVGLLACLSVFPIVSRADDASQRRDSAKTQFDSAEKQRTALEALPENSRTLPQYASLVSEYRRVYLITPRAIEVPMALNQVAALYRSMGDLFDEKYYQLAVDSYQFLLREYPTTRYREDALLAVAQIEQDDLRDAVLAKQSYEEFMALHPHSPHADEVRAILGKLNASNDTAKPASVTVSAPAATTKTAVAEKSPLPATVSRKASATDDTTDTAEGGSHPQVTRIRTWNADTYTRVVIDVGAEVKYQAARISGPDRIFFDIEKATITPAFLHKPVEVESGGFLKAVRVAQNQSGVVRVVLEVNHVKDYSVFLLPDPYRLIVDVYGTSEGAVEAARATTPPIPAPLADIPSAKPEKQTPERLPDTFASSKTKPRSPFDAPPGIRADASVKSASKSNTPPATKPDVVQAATIEVPVIAPVIAPVIVPAIAPPAALPAIAAPASAAIDATVPPSVSSAPSAKKPPSRTGKSAHEQAEEFGPPSVPEPTRDGQQSLSRALGLKVGRIVIDAGHGGHDTGTIGPTGLMEKDLCLDVALRVGKLIEQRLPGADVVFTRDDDTFVPLEQRTEIANDAHADLFLSIHANSSPDHRARGVETYYLNFTGSSDAMQVAARENALSDNSVHDLQDLVKKIARNEKIEESRDLAGNIQDSLAKRMDNLNSGDRNRGVRKAPFVVLIGADMPSVLAEISFISNPSDEQWLKKPENRQRVAEGLYHGIESYLHSTNSLTLNLNRSAAATGNRSGIVARAGNPQ